MVAVAGGALGPADGRAAHRRADRRRLALEFLAYHLALAAGLDADVVVEPALVPAAGHRADVARHAARGRPLADRALGRGQRAAADQASLHDHAEGRAAPTAPPPGAASTGRRSPSRGAGDRRRRGSSYAAIGRLATAGLPRARPVQRADGARSARDDPVPRAARPAPAHRPAGRRPCVSAPGRCCVLAITVAPTAASVAVAGLRSRRRCDEAPAACRRAAVGRACASRSPRCWCCRSPGPGRGGPRPRVPPRFPRAPGDRAPPPARRHHAGPRSQRRPAVAFRATSSEVNGFEQHARRHADIVMWFADWAHSAHFDAAQAARSRPAAASRRSPGSPGTRPRAAGQPTALPLARIIAGDFDAYIRRWARSTAAYGRPVRLRFAHEMNGDWYPWAETANGNRARRVCARVAPRPRDLRRRRRAQRDLGLVPGGRLRCRRACTPARARSTCSAWPASTAARPCSAHLALVRPSRSARRWMPFTRSTRASRSSSRRSRSTETGGSKAAWIRGMFDGDPPASVHPLARVVQPPQGGRLAHRELARRPARVRGRDQPSFAMSSRKREERRPSGCSRRA